MTKLVTGIEAIQSGKLIRRPVGMWFLPGDEDTFSAKEMRTPCFEVKPEFQTPREFWVVLRKCDGSLVSICDTDTLPVYESFDTKRIKVREVLDDE
jgi:hypothetical protein